MFVQDVHPPTDLLFLKKIMIQYFYDWNKAIF